MPLIPEEVIERIKSSVDIVEVVGEYVNLVQRGRNHVGLCPFHSEETPSFNVNADKQIYKCFGCTAGGNVFTFLQEHDKIGFVEAVAELGRRTGISVQRSGKGEEADTELFFRANELASQYFGHLLHLSLIHI